MLHFLLLSRQLLFLLDFLLQLMQLVLCFPHSQFFSLHLSVPLITLLPLHLYYQSFFLHKWVCSEFAALFYLFVVNNLSLAFVAQICFPLLLLPLQAWELLTGTDCIQDVCGHVDFCLLTFGWLSSSCYQFLQPLSQHVEPVACFSFTGELVQRDHPTLWEGLRALLAVQAACKDDQVLICLPYYLRLVNLVGCNLKLG